MDYYPRYSLEEQKNTFRPEPEAITMNLHVLVVSRDQTPRIDLRQKSRLVPA